MLGEASADTGGPLLLQDCPGTSYAATASFRRPPTGTGEPMTTMSGPFSSKGRSKVETTVEAEKVPKTRSTSSPMLRSPCGTIGGTSPTWWVSSRPTSSPTRASAVPWTMIRSSSALSVCSASSAPGSSSKRTVAVLAAPAALWTGKLTRSPGAVGSELEVVEIEGDHGV